MLKTTKSGKQILMSSTAEDEAIHAAAKSDPDAMPFTDAELAEAKPRLRAGRPIASVTKERITIRLTRSVVDQFRATGDGWQTRMDAALQDWLKDHSPAR
jgi:uncharacterized protein (DUF4415 family)